MSVRFWEYVSLSIALLLAFIGGMLVNERHQQRPPCPPTTTTTNSLSLGKVKNSSGPFDLSMSYSRVDTVYVNVIPDSIYQYLPKGMQRRLKKKLATIQTKTKK